MIDPQTANDIQFSLEQIKAGQRIAEAFLEIGRHYMMAGDPEKTLIAYASGVYYSYEPGQIRAALEQALQLAATIEESAKFKPPAADGDTDRRLSASACAQRILQLGLAARFADPSSTTSIGDFATKWAKKLDRSVAIIVDSPPGDQPPFASADKQALIYAFNDYIGTLMGGGSETAINNICSEIQAIHPKRIYPIAYSSEPGPGEITIDESFKEHRPVTSRPFVCHKPIQYWADILTSRVKPANVRVLGASVAPNAVPEYIVALALGSTVLMSQELKNDLLAFATDPLYSLLKKVTFYPNYRYVLRTYIGTGLPTFPPQVRERIAKALHETYRISFSPHRTSQSMADWDDLSPELKESNLLAVDHVVQKFNEIEYYMRLAEGAKIDVVELSMNEVETLAEMEHDRWILERLIEGWSYGAEKSFEKRIDPSLKSWVNLDDDVRDVDRMLVRKLPVFLSHFDIELKKIDTMK